MGGGGVQVGAINQHSRNCENMLHNSVPKKKDTQMMFKLSHRMCSAQLVPQEVSSTPLPPGFWHDPAHWEPHEST